MSCVIAHSIVRLRAKSEICSHRGVRLPYDWCETCFTHLGWLLSSADSPCSQFWPRLDCTKGWAWSGSKFFNTDSFQNFFWKSLFKKRSADSKSFSSLIILTLLMYFCNSSRRVRKKSHKAIFSILPESMKFIYRASESIISYKGRKRAIFSALAAQ